MASGGYKYLVLMKNLDVDMVTINLEVEHSYIVLKKWYMYIYKLRFDVH